MNAVVHQCDSGGGEDIIFVPALKQRQRRRRAHQRGGQWLAREDEFHKPPEEPQVGHDGL